MQAGGISNMRRYKLKDILLILVKFSEIRLYLPFSDWFGTEQKFVRFEINRKMVNTIWFGFDSARFWFLQNSVQQTTSVNYLIFLIIILITLGGQEIEPYEVWTRNLLLVCLSTDLIP